jgi:predicted DNA-binding transcriptional regulator AlpA
LPPRTASQLDAIHPVGDARRHHPSSPAAVEPVTDDADGENDTPRGGVYSGLAELSPDAIIDIHFLVGTFGLTDRTIRRYVAAGKLPPPIKIGRTMQWFAGELLNWLKNEAKLSAKEEADRRQHILCRTE